MFPFNDFHLRLDIDNDCLLWLCEFTTLGLIVSYGIVEKMKDVRTCRYDEESEPA